MAGRIPPEFIDALLARTDIVHLINSRVPLRKAGKDYQACCPFHDEKTPSFTVSPEKQFYHCFGCGTHGSAIGFLMEYERQGFHEVVEELAQQAGMEIPAAGETVRAGPDPHHLYDLLDQAAALYRRQLRRHPQASRAVDYLKGRGLTGEISATFGLGFAPPGWDFLLTTLGGSAPVRERLVQSGLVIEQDGRRYDRFRDRIMFPIRDRRGRVIGFGGRVLGDKRPKYLNSPETPIFYKGRELYGLYEAQQAKRRFERLLVVEGYLDVIALAQFGITYAIATLGTATSAEHLRLLLRTAPELIFCFDGDSAGRAAAWKALETALPLATGRQQIGFLFLPEGDDPDTLIRRQGRAEFEQHLGTVMSLSDFLFDRLTDQVDMSSLDGRARLATLVKPLLDKVPPGVFRDMLGTRLANLVGVARNRLDTGAGTGRRRVRPLELHRRPPREWLAAALVLQHPRLAAQLPEPDDWKTLDKPGIELLSRLLERIAADPEITMAQLVHYLEDSLDENDRRYLSRLTDPALLAGIPEDGRESDLRGAIEALNAEARATEVELLCRRTSLSDLDDEEKQRLREYLSDTRRGGG